MRRFESRLDSLACPGITKDMGCTSDFDLVFCDDTFDAKLSVRGMKLTRSACHDDDVMPQEEKEKPLFESLRMNRGRYDI